MKVKFQLFLRAILLCVVISAGSRSSFAQQATEAWVQHCYSEAGDSLAAAVVVGTNGNVIITGSTWNGSSLEFVTIAYSGSGLALWTNYYAGLGNDDSVPHALAVDKDGNIIVTGISRGGSLFDYATIKYSANGMPLWTNRYGELIAGGDNWANAVAVDQSGNVFVTGHSRGSDSDFDYATVAYRSDGSPLWTNRYNGPTNNEDFAEALAIGNDGKVFVTGYSTGNGSGFDYTTIAYAPTGVPLWTNRYNGPGNSSDYATALTLDLAGNVVVTGRSYGNGSLDYTTIAYSGAGTPLWTNRYNGPKNANYATAVAADEIGNVFVTGQSTASNFHYEYATVAYRNDGVPLWTNRYNGPGNGDDRAWAIAVDRLGRVVVAGDSDGDYTMIIYSNAGVPLSTNRHSGGTLLAGIALDAKDDVYLTGASLEFDGLYNRYHITTVKYSVPPVMIAENPTSQIARISSNCTFSVTAIGEPPLAYQWLFNTVALANETNSTITISNVSLANQGGYNVVVSNVYGSATSTMATLTVVLPPQFDSVRTLSENRVRLSFHGASNLVYRIVTSSNLLNWVNFTNISSPNGLFEFIDSGVMNRPQRFYRAVYPP